MDHQERMKQFAAVVEAMTNYLREKHAGDPVLMSRLNRFGFDDIPLKRLIIDVAEVSSSDQGWLLDISCADSSRRIRLTDPSTAAQEERLRWCMEDHAVLEPFNTSRCQESLEELKTYGRHLYDQLQIESLISGHSDISNVILNVAGTGGKPNVHLLHWEVLEDPILWPGGAETPWHIAVRRSFRSAPVIDKRIKASFNILYVVARPTKVNYIEYRLLSRRLLQIIDRINRDAMDVQLHILRPGTWGALVSYLDSIRQLKGMRHTDLVHFDMHGSLEVVNGREEYFLDFVRENGSRAKPRAAIDVAQLLAQHEVRTAVLNSCESASNRASANSNLANLFIEHGVASVVAMSYKMNSNAAEIFLDGFYNSLLDGVPDVTKAAADGRRAMRDAPQRRGRYGTTIPLHDWIIPVHYFLIGYQLSGTSVTRAGDLVQYDLDGSANLWNMPPERIMARLRGGTETEEQESQDQEGEDFYGRDFDIHHLETLLSGDISRMLLLTGPSQVGKSALLRYLMSWWYKSGFYSLVGYSSMNIEGDLQLLETWTRAIEEYERNDEPRPDSEPDLGQPTEEERIISLLKRGQAAAIVVDHLDILSRWSETETGSQNIETLLSILARLRQTRSRIILVARSMSVFDDLQGITNGSKKLQLERLTSYDAADLAANILSLGGGLSESMDAGNAVALEHIYKLLDYLPGVLKTELPQCSIAGGSMKPEHLLERLQYAELDLDFPIRTELFAVIQPLFHRDGPLGNTGVVAALFLTPFRLRCPMDLYPYFLRLVDHERFFPIEVSDEQIQRAQIAISLTVDPSELGYLDREAIISTLRANVTEIYFTEMVKVLSKSGLLREVTSEHEEKYIWIHPGLTLFLRKSLGPQNPFRPYIERAFSHYMVHSEGNSARIRREVDNYIVAAHLAEPLVGKMSGDKPIFTFTDFTRYFAHRVLRAFDQPKYDYETEQLSSVIVRAIQRELQHSLTRQENLHDLEWCLWCLVMLGDRSFIREGIPGLEKGRRFFELALELGNGINLPSQTRYYYDHARTRMALLHGDDQDLVGPLSPFTELNMQFGKCLIKLRKASRDAVAPSEEISLIFRDCQSAWTQLRNKWAELEGQTFSSLAPQWEIEILEINAEKSGQEALNQRALAFGRAVDHENNKEQGKLCFEVELAQLQGDIKGVERKIHEGLQNAVEAENLSGQYDFRRYLLELKEIRYPSEDTESLRVQLQDLCEQLGRNKDIFCPCRKARKVARRSQVSAPQDQLTIKYTLAALRDACFLCKLPDHQHRILILLDMIINNETDSTVNDAAIAYLGLCVKNQGDGWVQPGTLGDGSKPMKSPFTLQKFCSMLIQKTGESDSFLGRYLWTVHVERMKVVVLLSGYTWRQVTEILIRAHANASQIEVQETEIEDLLNDPQRLEEVEQLSWDTEETSLFGNKILSEERGDDVAETSQQKLGIDQAGLLKWFSAADGPTGETGANVSVEDGEREENDNVGESEARSKIFGIMISSGKLTGLTWVDGEDDEDVEGYEELITL